MRLKLEAVWFWLTLPFWLALSFITATIDYASRIWRAAR